MNEFNKSGNILGISWVEEYANRVSCLVKQKNKILFKNEMVYSDVIYSNSDQIA